MAVRKVGFLCLPDDMLEIFSAMTRLPGYRPEAVIDFDPNAYSYRMAEILQIPTATDLNILRRVLCDVVVIPDDRPDLRKAVAHLTGDDPDRIRTVTEMAEELGLPVMPEENHYSSSGFSVPRGLFSQDVAPESDPNPGLRGASRLVPRPSEIRKLELKERLVIDRMKNWNAVEDGSEKGGAAAAEPGGAGAGAVRENTEHGKRREETVEAGKGAATDDAAESVRPEESAEAVVPAERVEAGKGAETVGAADDAPASPAASDTHSPAASGSVHPASPRESAVSENISAVAETLSLAFDKRLLLNRILDIAVTSAGGDAGSIMLLDEGGEYLKIAVASGLSNEVIRSTRQRIGEGVAGNVLMEGRGRIVTDRLNDPRYRSGRERGEIAAAVCAPIRVGSRAIGVINISSKTRGDAFNGDTLDLLDKFGIQVAGVILKALKLPTQTADTAQAQLADKVESIMALPEPLARRLEAVAAHLAERIGASAGRVCLLDVTDRRLEILGRRTLGGQTGRPRFVPADEGIRGWVLESGSAEALMSTGPGADRRASFYVPLTGSKRLGLIEMECVRVDEARRVEVLETLAATATRLTSCIEKDRRHSLESRRTDQMLRLSDFAAELMCMNEDGAVVSLAVRATQELFRADLVTFRNPGDASLTFNDPAFGEQGDPASLAVLDFNGELSEEARTRGSLVTPGSMSPPLMKRLAALGQIGWAASLPLTSNGRDAGILTLFGLKEGSQLPGESEWPVLEKLGGYLARALERSSARSAQASDGFLSWGIFQDRLADEFKRASRYGRTFALTTLELADFRKESAERGHGWTDAARYALADFVRHEVREVDIVSWIQEGRIAVLSPEVGSDESALSRRIDERWEALLPSLKLDGLDKVPMRVRVMHYPTEIMTWEDCAAWIQDPSADADPEIRAAG